MATTPSSRPPRTAPLHTALQPTAPQPTARPRTAPARTPDHRPGHALTRPVAALAAAAMLLAACGAGQEADDAAAVDRPAADRSAPTFGPEESDEQVAGDEIDENAAADTTGAASEAADAGGVDAAVAQPPTPGPGQPSFEPGPEPAAPELAVNPFVAAADDPLSTFALDVDTSSFTQTLSWLESGQLPPAGVVRPEEFVNWPDHGYDQPQQGWAASVDGLRSAPWAEDRAVLRVGLRTAGMTCEERPPATLVFVVDTSGSMQGRPLQTVKDTLGLLVDQLRPDDRIGLVEYGDTARLLLEPTPLQESDDVRAAIQQLRTNGSTNAEDGLRLGYEVATRSLRPGDATSVVLASDGVANVGATGPDAILRTIGEGTDLGIQLLSIGVSGQSFNDHLMEQLANRGNGSTFYVRDERDAQRLFVDRLTETLVVVAEQSKVQVEMDPRFVESYRLIGYENRAVADDDFRDDEVDAGEVGAGHEVTALYELTLAASVAPDDVLGTVRVRWEDPTTTEVAEVDVPVRGSAFTDDPSPSLRTAVATTALAELLRGSPHVTWTVQDLWSWTRSTSGAGLDDTVRRAVDLAAEAAPAPGA